MPGGSGGVCGDRAPSAHVNRRPCWVPSPLEEGHGPVDLDVRLPADDAQPRGRALEQVRAPRDQGPVAVRPQRIHARRVARGGVLQRHLDVAAVRGPVLQVEAVDGEPQRVARAVQRPGPAGAGRWGVADAREPERGQPHEAVAEGADPDRARRARVPGPGRPDVVHARGHGRAGPGRGLDLLPWPEVRGAARVGDPQVAACVDHWPLPPPGVDVQVGELPGGGRALDEPQRMVRLDPPRAVGVERAPQAGLRVGPVLGQGEDVDARGGAALVAALGQAQPLRAVVGVDGRVEAGLLGQRGPQPVDVPRERAEVARRDERVVALRDGVHHGVLEAGGLVRLVEGRAVEGPQERRVSGVDRQRGESGHPRQRVGGRRHGDGAVAVEAREPAEGGEPQRPVGGRCDARDRGLGEAVALRPPRLVERGEAVARDGGSCDQKRRHDEPGSTMWRHGAPRRPRRAASVPAATPR